ncbi:MAG: OmpA family protein [Pseudomonadota bacterium]
MLRHPVSLLVASVVALSGCTETGFQGENPRTTEGAIVGGALGAAAGLLSSDENRGRNTAIGAALGAAVGGAIGNRLDQQEAALRQQIGDDRIQITNTGSELIVTLPQDILFAFDSDAVQPGLRDDLAALADNLQQYPDGTVEVIGHTDNVGSASYNLGLSERRAQSVANELVAFGVPRSRLRTIGVGDDQPRASNLTDEGRQQNRRVEIIIRPTTA